VTHSCFQKGLFKMVTTAQRGATQQSSRKKVAKEKTHHHIDFRNRFYQNERFWNKRCNSYFNNRNAPNSASEQNWKLSPMKLYDKK